MNEKQFIEESKKLGIEITEKQLAELEIYASYLLEVNKHTNLTAIKEKNQVYLKHFLDSLTLAKYMDLTKINTILDIGTGAGFPGMVLKILFPNLEVTLLDSNNKKVKFLEELKEKLKLTHINIIHKRAEEFCIQNRESFDLVTARAVSNMTTLTELSLPFVKINGYFIALKGSNEEEIKDSFFAIKELGGQIEEEYKFKLPIENSLRTIIKIKKIKKTSMKYPRRYEKIIKSPLK